MGVERYHSSGARRTAPADGAYDAWVTIPGPRPFAMIVHAYYEEDQRVRREAEALVASGRPVDVYALRRRGDEPTGTLHGVTVHRLDVRRHQGAGLGIYLAEYLTFLARAGAAVTLAHRRRQYAVLQVHSLPDFLAFAGVPLRLAGVPLLLDLHEAMPEFFRVRFPRAGGALAHRALELQERASIAIANKVLTVNDPLGERLVRRGVPGHKVEVIRNAPMLGRFDPAAHPVRAFAEDGVVRLVYAGALSPVYEIDLVLRAIADLCRDRPDLDLRFDVFGRDYGETGWPALAAQLGIGERVAFHGRIPIDEIPAAIARSDIGLAPTRRSSFTDFSLSTKLLEYAAMGKPVLASALPLVIDTFGDRIVAYEAGDETSFRSALTGIIDDAGTRALRVAAASERVRELAGELESARYVRIVEELAVDGTSSPATSGANGN
jgi:glycosyltransferase involved in cell wall biosynthesis